jgi:hypothetical protein
MIQQEPVLIDIRKPDEDTLEGLADIFIGALGFTGLFVILALVLGIGIAAFIYWRRSHDDTTPNQIAH